MKTFHKASCRSAGIKNEQFLRAVMKAVLFSFRLAVFTSVNDGFGRYAGKRLRVH